MGYTLYRTALCAKIGFWLREGGVAKHYRTRETDQTKGQIKEVPVSLFCNPFFQINIIPPLICRFKFFSSAGVVDSLLIISCERSVYNSQNLLSYINPVSLGAGNFLKNADFHKPVDVIFGSRI